MMDLSLEDDDLLDLDGTKPVHKVYSMTPDVATMQDRCAKFAADVKAKRVVDVPYDGTLLEMALWSYIDCFEYWYATYQSKKNTYFLELAFLAAAKCRAGRSWHQVKSKLLPGWEGRAEAVDSLPTLVKLLIPLPFECSRVRPNVVNSRRWRAVWFNAKTKHPVIPSEPFRIL